MSGASKSVSIKFISRVGTYMAMIQSPSGDLYQEYQRNGDKVTVMPDFSQTKPLLNFVCTSSRVAEGVSTPVSMRYYFNGVEITFDSAGKSSGLFTGLFERVVPSASQLYYGLRIVGNLVQASGYAPIVIKMVGKISAKAQSTEVTDDIQADYTIPVGPYTGTAYRVTIAAGDAKSFILSSPDDSCVLVAKALQGNDEITSTLYYKWYKAVSTDTGWQLISDATTAKLTVKAADVTCTRDYKVEVYSDKSMAADKLIGYDFVTVMDGSDPYDIEPCPSPLDITIEEDTSGNGSVTFTPKLVVRGKSQTIDTKFYFTLKSPAGVVLNTDAARKPTVQLSSFTVTRDDCLHGGGTDISLTIESVK